MPVPLFLVAAEFYDGYTVFGPPDVRVGRGGCLWCGNDVARERFDVGPIEDRLPLTPHTRSRLQELSAWHDGALDWDFPPDPSPWSMAERERFEQAAGEILSAIRMELGSEFEVVYEAI